MVPRVGELKQESGFGCDALVCSHSEESEPRQKRIQLRLPDNNSCKSEVRVLEPSAIFGGADEALRLELSASIATSTTGSCIKLSNNNNNKQKVIRDEASSNCIGSFVNKSSIFLHSLAGLAKQSLGEATQQMQQTTTTTTTNSKPEPSRADISRAGNFSRSMDQPAASMGLKLEAEARQLSAESSLSSGSGTSSSMSRPSGSQQSVLSVRPTAPSAASKPPLPPPPPRELMRAISHGQREFAGASGAQEAGAPQTPAKARRHALQEQSLERDAALSLKARELKHKRTSSIKSALRHAHIGPLRGHSAEKRAAALELASEQQVKSMPYELFEPPVTQRTFQRTKRRGAMLSDPKRQMSADTIGLRQLTDEYLHNAGVKPISSSGQCSLVALSGSVQPTKSANNLSAALAGGGQLAPISCQIDQTQAAQSQQPQLAIQAKLYEASKHILSSSSRNKSNSQESLSQVVISPGNLPWQSDVSIQCELIKPAQSVEPYETTGDILNTIAGPFRATSSNSSNLLMHANSDGAQCQLSATLKRGLSALSQHHLSPGAGPALNVVGSLKKSLSNTLDISNCAAAGPAHSLHHLYSQDSLPAYASLNNEPEEAADGHAQAAAAAAGSGDENAGSASGLIGQLTSKLARQQSSKFSVSRKGLRRALSFDCRGYKRLDAQHSNESSSSMNSRNFLSTNHQTNQQRNRSANALALDSSSPRPYLPQSASQVDFQLPLLPFHKMQEAIVSQRRLDGQQALADELQVNEAPDKQMSVDADALLCADAIHLTANGNADNQRDPILKPQDSCDSSSSAAAAEPQQQQQQQQLTRAGSSSLRRSFAPPRLMLDIPTIATPQNNRETDEDANEESGYTGSQAEASNGSVIVCLASPNVNMESTFERLSSSPSFCIESAAQGGLAANNNYLNSGQLTANDVFSRSKIKRPSTMMTSDAMSQVEQALSSSNRSQAQEQTVLRNRRQAIVPPKLTTDSAKDDEHDATDILVDIESDEQHLSTADEEATLKALRRKRSGGDAKADQHFSRQSFEAAKREDQKRLSGSQSNLPTFYIEPVDQASNSHNVAVGSRIHTPDLDFARRPDSQMTNVDSLVSSGSDANLSTISGKRDFTVTSPGGLTVSFGSSRNRRRSSIAVIPQMQICPGDLLVYSKQLIDRMNQSDCDTEPPQFLTIDDKKGKNIWSSFKLFDNRTLKARNELLCSLEDVLASLQPSTFVDEQLSHYKGMIWNEFLYETESRRSASSDALAMMGSQTLNQDDADQFEADQHFQIQITTPSAANSSNADDQTQTDALIRARRISATKSIENAISQHHDPLKAAASTGPTADHAPPPSSGSHRSRDPTVRSISSRFKEKPKLKRGQTVDSVFRIPLIPSSPLKHAQQHQQTPTAHLEEHELITIEDDERSSLSSQSPSAQGSLSRKNRSASTRSRSGSARTNGALVNQLNERQSANKNEPAKDLDSSFETDDAMDLIGNRQSSRSPYQTMMRQSSLSTLSSTITRTEQKRQRALWDLFQSECTFFFDHLMTLKNVYMEPLKKIQVEGFAMFADPDVLFGNLDELCCGVYDFCKEFLFIIMRTLKTRPEELNATDVLIKLYKKNPKIDHLRGVYHRYTLNYINALTYLESLRRQVEFVEFEKWSSRDVRCKKLQLTDLLVAPVQHIMRVPIILKDIESHTENLRDRDEIRAILAVEEASLRELDDKMRWLKNFERLLEIQKNISWPNVLELDSKLFIPEFLKDVLSKQPCEKLIVSPRRQIVHEGTLSNLDLGRACDMHVILFDDMLLLTRRKKGLSKKASTVCKTNSGGNPTKDDGSFKYIVYKQPLSLDRFYVHDVQQVDSQGIKHLFLLIVMNRFQQITNVHSFSAPNDDVKQTWLFKVKKTAERWKKNLSAAPPDQQPDQRIQPITTSLAADFKYQDSSSGQQTQQQQKQQPQTVAQKASGSASFD